VKYLTIEKDGQQNQVEITTGISSGGMIEILSGVELGDIVIVQEFVSAA
jgi:hypothetical protein